MSKPSFDLINVPFTDQNVAKFFGQMHKQSSVQATAADLSASHLWIADFDGVVGDLYAQLTAAIASGESMSYDVLKNGSSILSAPLVVSGVTAAKTLVDLYPSIDPTKYGFVKGDKFTVTRDYTAGGGATPMADNVVTMEPTTKLWR